MIIQKTNMYMRPCVKVTVSNSKNVIERTHACTLYRRSSQGYVLKVHVYIFMSFLVHNYSYWQR